MIEWGQKSKPKKIPRASNKTPKNPLKSHAEFPSHKNFQKTLNDLYLQIVLSAQKNLYLNQAAPKNTCENFPTQKNPKVENVKAKKVLRSSLSLEIQSTQLGG